jgi:exosortase
MSYLILVLTLTRTQKVPSLLATPIAMVFSPSKLNAATALWIGLGVAIPVTFSGFLTALFRNWLGDPEFSYGIAIPIIVAYLLWVRRAQLSGQRIAGPSSSLTLVLVGCGLNVVGSLSGTLLVSGIALVLTILGTVLYLCGGRYLRIVALPVALLILMVPVPSYTVGQVSWYLQEGASTISSALLRFLSVPVYQEGNLLNLPNYVLEVKHACSGSRSIFALLALALILGVSIERKWWARTLLVAAAPLLAVGANIVRIVGTGLIARQWGALAASESLHTTWGILVFVVAVMGLLGFQRFLQWAANEYA